MAGTICSRRAILDRYSMRRRQVDALGIRRWKFADQLVPDVLVDRDLVLFFALYFGFLPRLKNYPGLTFCTYLIGYSLVRLLIEPIRLDSIKYGNVQIPLAVSYIFLVVAVTVFTGLSIKYRKERFQEKK